MSATDLAFIRAYAEPCAPAAAESPTAHKYSAPHTPPQSQALPREAETIAAQAAPPAPIAATASDAAPRPRPIARTTSIHIGLGSVIPAPHANFAAPIIPAATVLPLNLTGGLTSTQSVAPGSKAPLSAFSGQSPANAATSSLKPALEVDFVRWPAVCQTLVTQHADRFDRLADELRHEMSIGNRTLAITGIRRGEGRTTMGLCLARRLAATNTKLVVVDAHFANPCLASQLGIGIQRGWEAVLTGEESLWEVLIESMADKLTILPLGALVTDDELAINKYRIAATLHELAEHYELVLLDAGPIDVDDPAAHWIFEPTVGVQSVILAYDARRGEAHRVAAGCLQLAQAGRRQLGLAETFTDK